MEIYFRQLTNAIVLASRRPVPGALALDYDWSDFQLEFKAARLGGSWYEITEPLAKFMRHFFGRAAYEHCRRNP
jgi:hypothetical protein